MTKRELALRLLQDAGPRGVTTAEFLRAGVGSRYGARLREIREAGYDIVSERLTASSFRYELQNVSDPQTQVADPSPTRTSLVDGKPPSSLRGGGLSLAWSRSYDGKWSRELLDVEAWLRYEDLNEQMVMAA